MAEVVTSDATGFRYESDLVSVLRAALPRLVFRHEKNSDVEVFSEVPAVHGVPDLAGIRFDRPRIRARSEAGVRPLSTDAEVRVVMAIGREASLSQVSERSGLSQDYVRRSMLPLLSELGWIERSPSGAVVRRGEAQWIASRVVTVEAKLRDWRKALDQARRQRLSGDAAYIALEAKTVNGLAPHLTKISTEGIGVIAVERDRDRARVLVRPARIASARREVGRNLLAERCLDMLERGTHEGQIYPVFGWTAPHLT